jgi:hypothetical protein
MNATASSNSIYAMGFALALRDIAPYGRNVVHAGKRYAKA